MYKLDIGKEDLIKLYQECLDGLAYGKKHQAELMARPSAHTLYGPLEYYIGACDPDNDVPTKARKLTHKTRRKDYMTYELDENYNVMRTVRFLDCCPEDRFEFFELDGMTVAFRAHNSISLRDNVFILKYRNRKPVYVAQIEYRVMCAQFYEYESAEKMYVTTYWYGPYKKSSSHGYPVDKNAPLFAVNSNADRYYGEDVPRYIDFSHWFQEEDKE